MLDILKIGLKLLEMKLESSKKFYEEITQKFQEKKSILEKRYNEEEVSEESFEDIRDTIVDDYQEQADFENLASMLIVSHDYFIFEHFLKLLAGNLLKKDGNFINDKYRKWDMPQIIKFFNKRGIYLEKIKGFQTCDVLRMLVNDIKHNGARVSKKLAKARDEILEDKEFREIKEIKVSRHEVNKYSEAIRLFYGNLISSC